MKKRSTLVFISTLTALLLAGCGGNNPSTQSVSTSKAGDSSVTSSTPSSSSQRQGEVISYFEMKLPSKIKFTAQDLLNPYDKDYIMKIGDEYLSYHDGFCNYFKKLSENSYSHYYKFVEDQDWDHEDNKTFDHFAALWTIGLYQRKRDNGYIKDTTFSMTISGKSYTGSYYYDNNDNRFAYVNNDDMKFIFVYDDDSGFLGMKVTEIDTTISEFPIPVPSSK